MWYIAAPLKPILGLKSQKGMAGAAAQELERGCARGPRGRVGRRGPDRRDRRSSWSGEAKTWA